MDRLVFTSLASSSAGCSYKVSGGGASKPLLIEAGLPSKQLQKALDFKVSELAGCVISHSHSDHCQGFRGLMAAGIDVYAGDETREALGFRNMDDSYLLHCLTPKLPRRIGDWDVLPFEAVHDVPSLGFLVGAPSGEKLLYLTDSAYSPYTFSGVNVLAVECNHSVAIMRANVEAGLIDHERFRRTIQTHMSIERLLEMIHSMDTRPLRQVFLLHLSSVNSSAAAFQDAIERATGVPVTVCAERG